MSEIIYKKIAEVQILHNYFLTTSDGTSFFARNQPEKEDLLVKKLDRGIYDIREVFTIRPHEDTELRMNEYNLKMFTTPLGFVVGIEVLVENIGGETVFKPRLEVPDAVHLNFSIQPRVSFFKTITNTSFQPVFPAIHYFSNTDKLELDEITVPTYKSLQLTNKLRAHQLGMTHEMGALIDFAGTLREAIQKTDGSDPTHWEDIDDRGFVSDADRMLLPSNFAFSFRKEDAVLDASFVLEDAAALEVKTISKISTEVLEDVYLNFSKIDETDVNSPKIPSGFYTLKVTANAGPEISYPVYLNKAEYDKDLFGMIDLRFDEPNSPYSLLDAGGFLKTRITAADVLVPHPVFELRFKNRRTFWRYNSESVFSAGDITDTNGHLVPESVANEKLVSIHPKGLTETLVPFINGTSLVLPQPEIPSLRVEKEKIFSEIFINQSNRLLNS